MSDEQLGNAYCKVTDLLEDLERIWESAEPEFSALFARAKELDVELAMPRVVGRLREATLSEHHLKTTSEKTSTSRGSTN